ncbi:MAG: PQQ-dependent sugar dehydrogenase [Noviherbaspirillum sp.]
MLPNNFYTVPNVDFFAERGCLGITADPNFASKRFIYIYCTVTDGATSHNRVLRVTEANDAVVAGSEQIILDLPNVDPGVQWHMGGALRFGVDGKLYVAVGGHEDNRLAFEASNSQKLSNPFGKILRINADGSIPGDNPYVNTPGAYPGQFQSRPAQSVCVRYPAGHRGHLHQRCGRGQF